MINLWMDARIKEALNEDIYMGDLTTDAIFKKPQSVEAYLLAKASGVIAGAEVFKRVFFHLDPSVEVNFLKGDGQGVEAGEVFAEIKGDASSILKGERTALNFIQRMSGIATRTHAFVNAAKPYGSQIVDTRKTVPLLRDFDKWAVRLGGGKNHRMGLFDAVMIKDNHIDAAGGITPAVELVKSQVGHTVKIEVEVQNIEGLVEAIGAKVDIVMLDNMTLEQMKEAVRLAHTFENGPVLEASGNMVLDRIPDVASTGVDVISVGELTHSVTALDISLKIKLL